MSGQVLGDDLLLERLGGGGDDDLAAAEDGRDQVGQRLAGAGAGLAERGCGPPRGRAPRRRPCRAGPRAPRSRGRRAASGPPGPSSRREAPACGALRAVSPPVRLGQVRQVDGGRRGLLERQGEAGLGDGGVEVAPRPSRRRPRTTCRACARRRRGRRPCAPRRSSRRSPRATAAARRARGRARRAASSPSFGKSLRWARTTKPTRTPSVADAEEHARVHQQVLADALGQVHHVAARPVDLEPRFLEGLLDFCCRRHRPPSWDEPRLHPLPRTFLRRFQSLASSRLGRAAFAAPGAAFAALAGSVSSSAARSSASVRPSLHGEVAGRDLEGRVQLDAGGRLLDALEERDADDGPVRLLLCPDDAPRRSTPISSIRTSSSSPSSTRSSTTARRPPRLRLRAQPGSSRGALRRLARPKNATR